MIRGLSNLAAVLLWGSAGPAQAQDEVPDTTVEETLEAVEDRVTPDLTVPPEQIAPPADSGVLPLDMSVIAADDLLARTGMSVVDLISALQTDADNVEALIAIRALPANAEVIAVGLSDLQARAGENLTALAQAIASRQATRVALREAIDGSAVLTGALDRQGVETADVVAVHHASQAQMVVIVDDTD